MTRGAATARSLHEQWGAAIVDAVGPLRWVIEGKEGVIRRYPGIAAGTPATPGNDAGGGDDSRNTLVSVPWTVLSM
jgi:hypothetical protein